MKFNNKRDSPDCTLTKIVLISYLLSHIIVFFVMYNPRAPVVNGVVVLDPARVTTLRSPTPTERDMGVSFPSLFVVKSLSLLHAVNVRAIAAIAMILFFFITIC